MFEEIALEEITIDDITLDNVYIGIEWEPNILVKNMRTGVIDAGAIRLICGPWYELAAFFEDDDDFYSYSKLRKTFKFVDNTRYLNNAGEKRRVIDTDAYQLEVRSVPVLFSRFSEELRKTNARFNAFCTQLALQVDPDEYRIAVTSRQSKYEECQGYKHVNFSLSKSWLLAREDTFYSKINQHRKLTNRLSSLSLVPPTVWRWHLRVPYLFRDYERFAQIYVNFIKALYNQKIELAERIAREVVDPQSYMHVRVYGYTAGRKWISCVPLF